VVIPLMVAAIFIDAQVSQLHWWAGEVGNDECDMTCASNHGIGAVGFALKGNATVGMDVTNNGELSFPADSPEFCKRGRFQDTYTAVIGMLVELVVEDDVRDNATAALHVTEKKGTGFVQPSTSTVYLA
jgi:hypothetical protein